MLKHALRAEYAFPWLADTISNRNKFHYIMSYNDHSKKVAGLKGRAQELYSRI